MPADAIAVLKARFPQATDRASLDHPAVDVPPADVPGALRCLRNDLGFDFLADITAIDWTASVSPRFTVVYHLYSTGEHSYVRIAAPCASDSEPEMPSSVAIWPGANWHEREVYDMFGIRFSGHPDLRRILMWEGYPHFPLRKEFPLAGIETPLPDPEVAAETKASVKSAPMMGGPFVAAAGALSMGEAEPRAKDESWTERSNKPGT